MRTQDKSKANYNEECFFNTPIKTIKARYFSFYMQFSGASENVSTDEQISSKALASNSLKDPSLTWNNPQLPSSLFLN